MDEMRRLRVKKYRQVEFQMLSLRSDFLPISSWTSKPHPPIIRRNSFSARLATRLDHTVLLR